MVYALSILVEPRRRAFRRRGGGSWIYDKPAVFILVGGDYAPSSSVEAEAAIKIVGIRRGSTIYTDNFKS